MKKTQTFRNGQKQKKKQTARDKKEQKLTNTDKTDSKWTGTDRTLSQRQPG